MPKAKTRAHVPLHHISLLLMYATLTCNFYNELNMKEQRRARRTEHGDGNVDTDYRVASLLQHFATQARAATNVQKKLR